MYSQGRQTPAAGSGTRGNGLGLQSECQARYYGQLPATRASASASDASASIIVQGQIGKFVQFHTVRLLTMD